MSMFLHLFCVLREFNDRNHNENVIYIGKSTKLVWYASKTFFYHEELLFSSYLYKFNESKRINYLKSFDIS